MGMRCCYEVHLLPLPLPCSAVTGYAVKNKCCVPHLLLYRDEEGVRRNNGHLHVGRAGSLLRHLQSETHGKRQEYWERYFYCTQERDEMFDTVLIVQYDSILVQLSGGILCAASAAL